MIVTVTLNPALDKTARVERLLPGKLNRLSSVTLDPGGKGINVSSVIKALGGRSLAAGFAGGNSGRELLERLNDRHIENDFITIASPTRLNLKVIDHGGTLTELNEPGPEIGAAEWEAMEGKLLSIAGADTIFVLSGSLPGGLPPDTYRSLCGLLRRAGSTVFVDADGEAFRLAMEAPPDYVKPNRYELLQYFGKTGPEKTGDGELAALCVKLLARGVRLAALSMGPEGAIFAAPEGCWRSPGLAVRAASTVGAGDSMVAAIVYGLEKKLPLEESLRLSVAASAGAAMTEGTNPPDRETVEKLLAAVELWPLRPL
ncbi:MAG: 1-phosphofructokinase [Spirochaetaceae bacterium]|nr:1-phosphofructokinase [Spirochaetaceae bacterium]